MRYNAVASPDRHAAIADLLGAHVDGAGRIERARAAADAVERLASELGLPEGLSEFGATVNDVHPFAERTLQLERLTAGNPRVLSVEDVETMIEASL